MGEVEGKREPKAEAAIVLLKSAHDVDVGGWNMDPALNLAAPEVVGGCKWSKTHNAGGCAASLHAQPAYPSKVMQLIDGWRCQVGLVEGLKQIDFSKMEWSVAPWMMLNNTN
jgi:hypothetical protein